MKKIIGFVFSLILSGSAFAVDKVVENVQAVCFSPAQQGKYWNVTAKGGINANGSIRLIAAGINGEATFSKGEWEGVQQVLKEHQAGDNDSYRKCAEKLTPVFLEKFSAPVSKAKPVKKTPVKSKSVTNSKSEAAKPAAAESGNHAETHGDKSPAFNGNNNSITYQ